MAESRVYRPAECDYCGGATWCEQRPNGKYQCRACKVERFFDLVLLEPIGQKLQGWQRKALRELYGTVLPESGLRQYRKGYVSTGKQNGKSHLLGGLPIYHLLMETDVINPEAYGVASAKDQAGIVYKAAQRLVEANPSLRARLNIRESTKRIIRKDGRGLYEVLSADGDVQDGKRPSLLLVDELHRFTKKKAETVLTVLKKGQVSRAPIVNGIESGEPLKLQITTAGDEHECPLWYAEYDYAMHVADGSYEDPSYYALIYQADPLRVAEEKDYWMSRAARVAGNPSHQDNGGFLSDKEIEAEMLEAVKRPEKYSDFIRLNLNVPLVSTGTPAVQMDIWYENGGSEDLRQCQDYADGYLLASRWELDRRPCYVGVDMAWTSDMAGISLVFPPRTLGDKWRFLFYAYVPEGMVDEIERVTRAPLRDWVRRGFVTTMPGMRNSVLTIEDKVRWVKKNFQLQEACFDPFNMQHSMETLAKEMTTVLVDQKIPILTTATKEFLDAFRNNEFEHANNPVMNWHVSCLSLDRDHSDNVKPNKPPRDISKKRIDLVAATITAMTRAITAKPEETPLCFTLGVLG